MRLCVYLLKPFDSNPPFLYPLGGRERMHLRTNGLSKNKSDFLAYLISIGLGDVEKRFSNPDISGEQNRVKYFQTCI